MKSLISSYWGKLLDFVKQLASSCFNKLSDYVKGLPSNKRYIVLALIAVLVLILIFGFSRCSAKEAPVAEAVTYIVMADDLDVHKKAKESSRVLSQLPFALEVDVLEEKTVKETTWGRIDDMKLEDGTKVKAGWIDLRDAILLSELIAMQEPEQEPEDEVQTEQK